MDAEVECQCKNCGYLWRDKAKYLVYKKQCPVCSGRKVIKGVNDISTTHPYLLPYFKNADEAYINSYKSIFKATFICPDCQNEFKRRIRSVIERGFHCVYCDKGVSLPNRMLRNLMKELNIDSFIYEYSPEWANKYRYDGYFEVNNKKYIVEMDGGFHFHTTKLKGRTEAEINEIQSKDRTKDELATKHDIEVIRIPCEPSTLSNISRQIINSKLSEIFTLDEIDWEKLIYCDKLLMQEICDCYNKSERKTAKAVSDTLKINIDVVRRFLHQGDNIGLCYYSGKEARNNSKRTPVLCTNIVTNESQVYSGIVDLYNDMKKRGINFSKSTTLYHIQKGTPYHGYIIQKVDCA